MQIHHDASVISPAGVVITDSDRFLFHESYICLIKINILLLFLYLRNTFSLEMLWIVPLLFSKFHVF